MQPLAAAVGIQRDLERDIGRGVAREDAFCDLVRDLGLETGRFAEIDAGLPAVVDILAAVDLVAALHVRYRPAPLLRRERTRRQHLLFGTVFPVDRSFAQFHEDTLYCMFIQ